jgi:hypothetical protein
MTTQLTPNPLFRATDFLGFPLVGGKLFTYIAGSSTKQATFTDSTGGTPNTNPVILNVRGEAQVWLNPTQAYKFVLAFPTDTDPPTNPIWTVDNITIGNANPTYNIIPGTTNLYTLGNSSFSWANVYIGPNAAPVLDTTSGNFGYYARTTAEIAASILPTAFVWPEGDIRRYGATTGASDNSTAINSALSVSGAGGAAAFIPPGTWKVTTQVTVASQSSMYGMGESSIIAPQSCNGLVFTNQGNVQKSRYFRDFQVNATTGDAFTGITVNYTAASGNLVTGCFFQNLSVQNFGTGVFCRGLWMSSFIDCFLLNCYQGYYFHGQSVFVRIEGGEIQATGSITGAGDRIGINIDSVAGESAQSIHVIATQIDAYDIAVAGGPMLYNVFENLDIAFANKYGFNLGATSGNTIIRDCAIQTNSASFATIGVNCADLGAATTDKLVIDGNWITAFQANAGSIGIFVGTNQKAVVATNNTIGSSTSPFATGIKSNGVASNFVAKFNTIYGSTTAINLSSSGIDVEIGPNTIQNGTALAFSGLTPAGFSYFSRGSFTLTLTGMTAGTSGTVNWVASGKTVSISVASAGISGTSNVNTMTGTGLPAALWPVTDQTMAFNVIDNGAGALGSGVIAAATGTITFKKDFNGTAFTAAGAKGLNGFNSVYGYT